MEQVNQICKLQAIFMFSADICLFRPVLTETQIAVYHQRQHIRMANFVAMLWQWAIDGAPALTALQIAV